MGNEVEQVKVIEFILTSLVLVKMLLNFYMLPTYKICKLKQGHVQQLQLRISCNIIKTKGNIYDFYIQDNYLQKCNDDQIFEHINYKSYNVQRFRV